MFQVIFPLLLLLQAIPFPGPGTSFTVGGSTYTYVQNASGGDFSGTGGASVSTSAPITIGAGKVLIVLATQGYNSGSPASFTCTGNIGDTFTNQTSAFEATVDNAQMSFFAGTSAGGSATFTCSNTNNLQFRGIIALHYTCSGPCTGLDAGTSLQDVISVSGTNWVSSAFTTSAKALTVQCGFASGAVTWDGAGSPMIGPVAATLRWTFGCQDATNTTAQTGITGNMTLNTAKTGILLSISMK